MTRKHRGYRKRSHNFDVRSSAKKGGAAQEGAIKKDATVPETSPLYLPNANPPRKRLPLLLFAAFLWLLCIAALAFVAMQS